MCIKWRLVSFLERMKNAVYNNKTLKRFLENHFDLQNVNGITEEDER